ncbi:nuclear transport factor 2 family protein [Chitinophaga nivalis]|uniref:Nuclear transport factor 2 family protein n=1 Tax=Chitinophaga nivalis TaxID=2991709 RepID=A0ABT3IR14_9BACT|nr:nuclear transport factor 2 family protein [Chitinophaga nivalis]MCW3463901.1 nuclear transport factor 2 family protein [Chitinophaga nivalis]MCW3486409.1 nuclear transport factor 2 family protein [Chitinophaga nivalis]
MSVEKIAVRLAELCRQGKYETAQRELYAEEVVSIEPYPTAAFEKVTKGLAAIIEKGHKFESMVAAIHDTTVSTPLIAGNSIAFKLTMDITMKGQPRQVMEEICVYEVKDGKIVAEQFFM